MLEEEKWDELWKLPQALEWERMSCEGDVGLYVRLWVAGCLPGASMALIDQIRQLDSKIGVSPRAMQQLRWEIGEPVQHMAPVQSIAPAERRAYVPATG